MITVNGVDLRTAFGFVLGPDIGSLRGHAGAAVPTAAVVGMAGVTPAVPLGEIPAKTLTLEGTVQAASRAALQTALDGLGALLAAGELRLVFADETTRWIGARLTSDLEVRHVGPGLAVPHAKVRYNLAALDPYWTDVDPQEVTLTSTPTALPLGTAPSAWQAQLVDGTNPVLTYLNGRRDTVDTLGFTRTLGANDYLEVVSHPALVWRWQSGVRSNDLAARTSGRFFALDAVRDGDPRTSLWPAMSLNSGTGKLTYYRRWR